MVVVGFFVCLGRGLMVVYVVGWLVVGGCGLVVVLCPCVCCNVLIVGIYCPCMHAVLFHHHIFNSVLVQVIFLQSRIQQY